MSRYIECGVCKSNIFEEEPLNLVVHLHDDWRATPICYHHTLVPNDRHQVFPVPSLDAYLEKRDELEADIKQWQHNHQQRLLWAKIQATAFYVGLVAIGFLLGLALSRWLGW